MVSRALIAGLSAALALSACGGDNGDGNGEQPEAPTEPVTEQAGPVDQASIEQCLADAGQDVVAGNVPILSGVKAVGIDGGGSLNPGGLSVAVFVYGSEEEAKAAAASPIVNAVADSAQEGTVFVVYADPPAPDLVTTVEDCAFAGG
jgi:hypothetical protein